jgi:hypothetical protein
MINVLYDGFQCDAVDTGVEDGCGVVGGEFMAEDATASGVCEEEGDDVEAKSRC